MGVSHAEVGSKHAAGSSVGGDPVRRRISGTLPDVTVSDPSAQVFHDTDFSHAASSSECGFGECDTLYPKQELTSYGRLGSELMYSKVQALE